MFGLMRRAVSLVSGNVSYGVSAAPVRGSDSTPRDAIINPAIGLNDLDGAATSAGFYARSAPFVYNAQAPVVTVSPGGAGYTRATPAMAGNLVDPSYLMGALLQGKGS